MTDMPKRVQMRRDRPWRLDHPGAVIVARPTIWGNPWRAGNPGTVTPPELANGPPPCVVWRHDL